MQPFSRDADLESVRSVLDILFVGLVFLWPSNNHWDQLGASLKSYWIVSLLCCLSSKALKGRFTVVLWSEPQPQSHIKDDLPASTIPMVVWLLTGTVTGLFTCLSVKLPSCIQRFLLMNKINNAAHWYWLEFEGQSMLVFNELQDEAAHVQWKRIGHPCTEERASFEWFRWSGRRSTMRVKALKLFELSGCAGPALACVCCQQLNY